MYNVAIVGCGGMSYAWIKIITERSDCLIVALVDVNKENSSKKKQEYSLSSNIYNDLETALDKEHIDLVIDITPPEFHYHTVTTALKAGCQVFGEKPMSDNLEDAIKMVACANETGNEYFVMQNRRYLSSIQSFKDFIGSGKLGSIGQLSADFQLNPHFGGFRDEMDSPLIADMAIHTFDAARFLLNMNPVSVYCHEFNPSWSWYKGNANAVCIFEMEDGTVFDYRGSWCANGLNTSWESKWRGSCEKGAVSWDGFNDIQYEEDFEGNDKFGIEDEESTTTIDNVTIESIEEEGHKGCIEEMFKALSTGTRPPTDCRDNLLSIKMVYKAIESARTNKVIKF